MIREIYHIFLMELSMGFWQWLSAISQSAGGPAQPFTAHWQYVVTALAAPAILGALAAGLIILTEKLFGIRLSGGSI
jgi:hypothetical protein